MMLIGMLLVLMSLSQPSGAGGEGRDPKDVHTYSRHCFSLLLVIYPPVILQLVNPSCVSMLL